MFRKHTLFCLLSNRNYLDFRLNGKRPWLVFYRHFQTLLGFVLFCFVFKSSKSFSVHWGQVDGGENCSRLAFLSIPFKNNNSNTSDPGMKIFFQNFQCYVYGFQCFIFYNFSITACFRHRPHHAHTYAFLSIHFRRCVDVLMRFRLSSRTLIRSRTLVILRENSFI